MLQWLRPSTGSNDSTATGASSPLNVKWNEAALPVALYFNVLAECHTLTSVVDS